MVHGSASRSSIWALTLALVIAAALRLFDLDRLPGGLHFDLGANLLDVADVLERGTRPIYFPRNNGREPLVIYMQAVSAASIGLTPFVARLVTAFLGILSVAATAYAARQTLRLARLSDSRLVSQATFAAAMVVATLYWGTHFGRFGLRTAAIPFFLALTMGFAARTIGEIRRGGSRYIAPAIVSGAALGLALDSYTGARLAPIVVVASFALAWTFDRRRAYAFALTTLTLASIVMVSPLALHYAGHPGDLTTHTWDTSFLNPANPGGGTISAVARGVTATVVSFVWRGDPNAGENLPGRALLDPLGALGLLVGIVATIALLVRQRRKNSGAWLAAGFVAIWLGVMSLPMALALPVPAFVRISGAIVPLAIIVCVGWVTLARRVAPSSMTVVISLLGLASATWTAADYFIVWGNTYAYRGAMADKAEAAVVAASAPETRVFLAPLWARDFGVEFLTRTRPPETFATGAGAIVPTGTGSALYLFPGEDRAAAERVGSLVPGTIRPESIHSSRDPSVPLLWALRVAILPAAPTPRWTLENDFGLIEGVVDRSGDGADVTTRWLATRRPTADYTMFVQARIGDRVPAQRDGPPLDGSVPTTRWRANDIVIDRRRIDARTGESLDGAKIYVGLYESATGRRARVLDSDGAPSTIDEIALQ